MTSDTPKILKVYSFSQWQYSILLQERDQDMDTPFACNTCGDESGILYVMSEGSDKSYRVCRLCWGETWISQVLNRGWCTFSLHALGNGESYVSANGISHKWRRTTNNCDRLYSF